MIGIYLLIGLIIGCLLINILSLIKQIINKHLPIINIILFVISIILFILNINSKLFSLKQTISLIISIIIYLYYVLITIFTSINSFNNNLIIDYSLSKINESDYDYFIILNKHNKIIKVSNSVLKISKKSLSEILYTKRIECLFYNIKLISINDVKCGSSDYDYLIDEVLNANNEQYHIVISIDNDEVKYILDVKNINKNNNTIGKLIILKRDLTTMLINGEENTKHYIEELNKNNKVKHQMMNLSHDICLYYDYQNKVYITTKNFNTYTITNKKVYAFKELIDLILDEEKEKHIRDFSYVNNASPYRMKYHMKLNGVIYNCIEDAMYLDEEKNDLISVIHIFAVEDNIDIITSKDANNIVDSLNQIPVDTLIKELDDITETVKLLDTKIANNNEDN